MRERIGLIGRKKWNSLVPAMNTLLRTRTLEMIELFRAYLLIKISVFLIDGYPSNFYVNKKFNTNGNYLNIKIWAIF